MEMINEKPKKSHWFRNLLITVIFLGAASFVTGCFVPKFAEIADNGVTAAFALLGKNAPCTAYSDFATFVDRTVGTAEYLVEVAKENLSGESVPAPAIPQTIFTSAAFFPVAGRTVTSSFGFRTNPISGNDETHTGIDIASGEGSPVAAAWPGTVAETGEDEIYGKYVVLKHSGNLSTRYCHLSEIEVSAGDYVENGGEIGKAGSTGWATGSHLHFEVMVDGRCVDPAECLIF